MIQVWAACILSNNFEIIKRKTNYVHHQSFHTFKSCFLFFFFFKVIFFKYTIKREENESHFNRIKSFIFRRKRCASTMIAEARQIENKTDKLGRRGNEKITS